MLETVEKAKQIGALVLERVSEYLELFKISAEIQGQNLVKRVVAYAVVGLFSILSLIFVGVAVIITCWDTPYRLASAWGVAGFYALTALLVYFAAPKADSASALNTVREELQQDIKLMKDLV